MSKYKYRPHCGSLDEAMKRMREFDDIESLKSYVVSQHILNGIPAFTEDDIVISEQPNCDDDRIGWKSVRYVCTKRYYGSDYIKEYGVPQCIGYIGE